MTVDWKVNEIKNSCIDIANNLQKNGVKIRTELEHIRRNSPENAYMIPRLEKMLDTVRQTHTEVVFTVEHLNQKPSF